MCTDKHVGIAVVIDIKNTGFKNISQKMKRICCQKMGPNINL